eukprot:TRINITY_DN57694_c0_g1_i1.p1 TRINITY_DN57694_c0_g1~~TRINITY_DN57694_c0_g1_i1.p1  ORF type:complete len:213 (+),score=35.83 TRINITY_DN57694_c0_g1_i1:62-640(+)
MAKHVCIKVPGPRDLQRRDYEHCATREAWVRHCLGDDGVYVGRPKNDGGWHLSKTVKGGSMFANPYSVKEYPLDEALERFDIYLRARLDPAASQESVIKLLPPRARRLAESRFKFPGQEREDAGRSVAHLGLSIVGDAFRSCLRDLAGRRLGCFCAETEPCHAKRLAAAADAAAELDTTLTKKRRMSRKSTS